MRRLALGLLMSAIACGSPAPRPAAVPDQPSVRPAAEEQATGTVRVTASTLNVRRDPSTASDIIGKVSRGDRLTVVWAAGDWMKVRLENGELGWVSAQHVRRDGAGGGGRCPDTDYRFVKTPTPSFSESGPHGLVVVEATVDTKGDVIATKIVSNSTEDDALGLVAEREIRQSKFVPPMRNCVAKAFVFTYKRSF
jgi:hypothetical protein